MTRKWIELVDEDGNLLTAAVDYVILSDDAVADDLRDAVKEKLKDSHLVGIAASDLTVFANRTAYDAKQKLPRSSSTVTDFGNDEDNALIVQGPTALRLTAQASDAPFLKKAIEIANVMLAHGRSFESELSADKTTRRNLLDVKVVFRRPEEGSLYGWTERKPSAKVIYVNEVLLHRMEMIDQADDSHEYQCIVFMVAAIIFHECAHLTLRWKNILYSPPKFDFEVGSFMESKLFGGICRLRIQQRTGATPKKSKRTSGKWTKEMAILDVVKEFNGLCIIRADHLNKFFTPGKLRDKALFPLTSAGYPRTKGATAYLDSKRRRTSPEDPNIIMPPLCGISKNRNTRRKLSP